MPTDYSTFADELIATDIISDPWLEGRERFRLEPVMLSAATYDRFAAAGEAIGRAYDELAAIVLDNPALLDDYFHLTPYQKLMWLASRGRWHGIARLDLFLLGDGSVRICEMNSDTPSGEAETVIFNAMRHRFHGAARDPNAGFETMFIAMALEQYAAAAGPPQRPLSIGLLYPTDLPEDLSMIALYRRWFESRGHTVTLGSPFNIYPTDDGRVALFDTPIDLMIRHYKTDWWGEREPAWSDEEPYLDPLPIDSELRLLLDADARGATVVINPFGAVLTQNKLTMAFMWDHLDLFTEESRRAITGTIPETRRLDLVRDDLVRSEWVLKSDYGCEGDEVVLGPAVDDAIWQASLDAATEQRWTAQRFFQAQPDADGAIANYGLYLIAGRAAGIFTRLSPAATDYTAVIAPTFIEG